MVAGHPVCQEARDNPGPFTAYTQQHTALRKEGILNPNPRRQFLKDLEDLIEENCKEGYWPLVMMDANGDYTLETGGVRGLRELVERMGLVDVCKERFPGEFSTYGNGTKGWIIY